jgi:hypothetical protein
MRGIKPGVFLLDVLSVTIALPPVIWSKYTPLHLKKQPLKMDNTYFLII